MLDRNFLVNSRLPLGEFVQWVAASKYELTPFEAKLFELIERMAPAHVDDEETDAETMKQIIDLGVMADSFGYCDKADFERVAKLDELMSDPWIPWEVLPEAVDYFDDLYKMGADALDADKSNDYAERLDQVNKKLIDIRELIHP